MSDKMNAHEILMTGGKTWVTNKGKIAKRACAACGGPTARAGKGRICARCWSKGVRRGVDEETI